MFALLTPKWITPSNNSRKPNRQTDVKLALTGAGQEAQANLYTYDLGRANGVDRMGKYDRPDSLSRALALLDAGPRVILAGGTDIYPATLSQSLAGPVLDITGIDDLREIAIGPREVRIGACVTWSDIAEAKLPLACKALQMAAREVGGRQIQNAGTIAGNLCNASPAADGVPPLLMLNAQVELVSSRSSRRLALSDFITGPRRTSRVADELLTAVILPKASLTGCSTFLKLGARAYLVISIAAVAVRLATREGVIADAAVAVGSCGPVATRLLAVEEALVGLKPAKAAAFVNDKDVFAALRPIDDIRATADYRREAAANLVRRALSSLAETAA